MTVGVEAVYSTNRKLGNWTTGRRFEVLARRGQVVLDLRSSGIPAGDIEITLTADHSMIKLLVPDDAVVQTGALEQIGRCWIKDTSSEVTPDSRKITITGQLRRAEIRVRRGSF
jgi:hypothetical protein